MVEFIDALNFLAFIHGDCLTKTTTSITNIVGIESTIGSMTFESRPMPIK
jgi:hypothetical protein